jgi:quercetin dioxygenase-like cupin family protein
MVGRRNRLLAEQGSSASITGRQTMPDTTHQPTGEYPHPAAIHHVDLTAESDGLLQQLPGTRRQGKNLAREGGLSVLLMAMEAGDELDEHAAAGPAAIQVLRGSIVVTSEETALTLGEGEMAMYQPGVRHGVRADQRAVILLTVAERSLAG